jgi:hypothetical protein
MRLPRAQSPADQADFPATPSGGFPAGGRRLETSIEPGKLLRFAMFNAHTPISPDQFNRPKELLWLVMHGAHAFLNIRKQAHAPWPEKIGRAVRMSAEPSPEKEIGPSVPSDEPIQPKLMNIPMGHTPMDRRTGARTPKTTYAWSKVRRGRFFINRPPSSRSAVRRCGPPFSTKEPPDDSRYRPHPPAAYRA